MQSYFLPNLAKFCNQNINTKINTKIATVEVGSSEIFSYPFVHLTGHGNVFLVQMMLSLINSLPSGGFYILMIITVWTNSSEKKLKNIS